MTSKIPVGILGATGTVGQRFIQLLHEHPWFEISWLAASDRSAGKVYAEAAKWNLATPIPAKIAAMKVSAAAPDKSTPKLVFAALDATAAQQIEPAFAEAGHAVVSNSSAFRMAEDVPLIIPEVNGDHAPLIKTQKWYKNNGGFMVTNPNCSAIGLVLALAPLHRRFGIDKIFVATMQAISGAGYPGVPSMDILGNVIPYIAKEEDKMEAETRKLLGTGKLAQRLARNRCRPCTERALQPRCRGRWTHRIRLAQAAQAGDRRRDHRGLERIPLPAAEAQAADCAGAAHNL